MAEGSPGFKTWLLDLLDSLGLDGEVYGEYILGTLESSNESEPEDVREAISELLSGLMENGNYESVCQEIIGQWHIFNPVIELASSSQLEPTLQEKVDQLLRLPEKPKSSAVSKVGPCPPKLSTSEKNMLLQQYDYESEDDEEDEQEQSTVMKDDDTGLKLSDIAGIEANTNRAMVTLEVQQEREQMKAAHTVKLDRDQTSREVQRQRQQERKVKEKQRTQKKERRR